MNQQEIINLFKKNGCNTQLRICNIPVFNVFYLDEITNKIDCRKVYIQNQSINGIKDFITKHKLDKQNDNVLLYIYEYQDFSKDMKYIRYYKWIDELMILRKLKLNKIYDRIKQDIQ